jgi:hypothetical protein
VIQAWGSTGRPVNRDKEHVSPTGPSAKEAEFRALYSGWRSPAILFEDEQIQDVSNDLYAKKIEGFYPRLDYAGRQNY